MEDLKVRERYNMPVTALLILGLVTIIFPLYMTVVIAFKQPSEMTNSIAGILSLPKHWSLANFAEAMRVTDFWRSLFNSFMISAVTVIISVLVHSMIGYAVGRSKAKNKWYNFVYLYIVSGMFVPFAILMMPLVKQTAQMGIANIVGVILCYVVFYMPMNLMHGTGRVERRDDAAGNHVGKRTEHAAAGADDVPDTVRNELQPGVCILSAGAAADSGILHHLSETDLKWCCKWRGKIIYIETFVCAVYLIPRSLIVWEQRTLAGTAIFDEVRNGSMKFAALRFPAFLYIMKIRRW